MSKKNRLLDGEKGPYTPQELNEAGIWVLDLLEAYSLRGPDGEHTLPARLYSRVHNFISSVTYHGVSGGGEEE